MREAYASGDSSSDNASRPSRIQLEGCSTVDDRRHVKVTLDHVARHLYMLSLP